MKQISELLKSQRSILENDDRFAPIIKFLDDNGYDHYIGVDESVYLFQKRIDDGRNFLCSCNDKLHMNVKVFDFTINDNVYRSIEMEMCHEMSDGKWFKQCIYRITVDEFIEYYETAFNKLVYAWESSY